PIGFAVAPDPVGTGLVARLVPHGGNVPGLSTQAPDLVGKRLELLREAVPELRRLAILANIGYPMRWVAVAVAATIFNRRRDFDFRGLWPSRISRLLELQRVLNRFDLE